MTSASTFPGAVRFVALCMAAATCGCAAPKDAPPPATVAVASDVLARWDEAALRDALEYTRAQRATGLLIIHDRRVVAERHWPLPDDEESRKFQAAFVHGRTPDGALLEDVASQQKSFIAVLMGIAVDRGLVDVERPVSAYVGPGWSKSPASEPRITVRHLLEMTSGLTEGLGFESEPGERFFYNTPAYAVTKGVLEKAAGQPLDELTRRWLTEPLGMDRTAWRPRPPALAVPGNPTGLVTTPRDVAKIGQLVLDRGLAADGRRVISTAQLDAMLRPTPTNPAYARLWWINGGGHRFAFGPNPARVDGPLVRNAPADAVLALGAMDRLLFVSPSRRLIVVRTGQAAPAPDFREQLWSRLAKALPADS